MSGGKYFTHCIGVNAPQAVYNFEKMVQSLGVPVEVEQTQDHVPSFMEKWVWFQVTRLEGEITEEVNDSIVEKEAEPQVPEVSSGTIEAEAKEGEGKVSGEQKKVNGEEKKDKAEDKKVNGEEKRANGDEKKVNGDAKKDDKKERASPDKKDEKKAGAKDLKDKLETPKGLTKEKSNVDKKAKPTKK